MRASVSRETQTRLDLLQALVVRWSKTINLVSRSDLPHLAERHVADSLQLAPLMPPLVERALDLGSGAGFPGLPLAIATGVRFTLVESDNRKCAFLREAARITEAPVEVVHARIEDVSVSEFAVITARALAPLPELLGYATRFLAKGGVLLFPKGENAEAEISQAEATWTMRVERHISAVHARGVILRISEVERA